MTLERRLLLGALPLLSLPACTLGPHYERPAADIPLSFRATPATAEAAWPAPDWWRGFGNAELNDFIDRARAANQDLAAAAARVVQADAQARISGAPLLPTVTANPGFTYQRTGTGRSRSGGSSSTVLLGAGDSTLGSVVGTSTNSRQRYFDSRTYTATLGVSYDLDFWGRYRALAEAGDRLAIATRFDQETTALTVINSTALAFVQVLAFRDRLAVAERNLRDAEQILAAFRARLSVGTANALDVSQQEALVAGIRANVPALRSQAEQQVIALGILTGQPPERVVVTTPSLDALTLPEVRPGLPSELLARRPDVQSAEANLLAQNANIRAARALYYPQVALTSSGGLVSAALSGITGPGTLIAQLALSATQTIFDNGRTSGGVLLERGRYQELVATYRQAILQSFTDVETALTQLRYATEQEALERDAVRVAQRSADIGRAQLRAGISDIITALNTQSTLFNTLDLLVQVRLARVQALVNLNKALGGGWRLEGAGS